jgi:hypothetical protein
MFPYPKKMKDSLRSVAWALSRLSWRNTSATLSRRTQYRLRRTGGADVLLVRRDDAESFRA